MNVRLKCAFELRILLPKAVRLAAAVLTAVMCGLASVGPHSASASDARLERAMQFGEQLLDRECVWTSSAAQFNGRAPFDSRSLPAGAVSEHVVPMAGWSGALRSDRAVSVATEGDPLSGKPGHSSSMATRQRRARVQYAPSDTQIAISSFVERPLGDRPFEVYASQAAQGIWFGYLLVHKLPEFSRLASMVDWSTSADGTAVRGTFEGRELLFVFADLDTDLPQRVEIRDLTPAESGPMGRTIQFLEWDVYDGIECPRKVAVWDLAFTEEREWLTTYYEYTLESVGPVMELSDRYGDYFTEVPDGVPVQVNDYMGIEFIWEDGEIVRKVDREKLSSLIGQPFFGSPLRRFVLMGAGMCVLAAAGWFVYRRSWRAEGP